MDRWMDRVEVTYWEDSLENERIGKPVRAVDGRRT